MDPLSTSSAAKKPASKTPQSFLGENSNLVNLDNLIKPNNTSNNNAYNPFSDTPVAQPRNLFQQQQPPV
jgi:epsin